MMPSIFYVLMLCANIVESRNRWDDQYLQLDNHLNRIRAENQKQFKNSFQYQDLSNYEGVKANHPSLYKAKILNKHHPILQDLYNNQFILSQNEKDNIKRIEKNRYPEDLKNPLDYDINSEELDKRAYYPKVHRLPEFKKSIILREKRQVDTLGGSLIAGASFFDDNKVLKPLMHGKKNVSIELKNVTISKNTIMKIPLFHNDTIKNSNISSLNLTPYEAQKMTINITSFNHSTNTLQELAVA